MSKDVIPTPAELANQTEAYLAETLLPFWMDRCVDSDFGGVLTYFDRHGQPTGETDKTFLMQIRTLYTFSAAHRAGYGDGRCLDLAGNVADFILDHYWDDTNGGWFWIADRAGNPTVRDKIGYGQCFGIYAFSEYALARGDSRARDAALRTYDVIGRHMIDTRHGGYYERMFEDWQSFPSDSAGGDRKTLDMHMHMMEALTTLYELTGDSSHRRRLEEVIGLILSRMLDPQWGTGLMQFTLGFEPVPAILFENHYGRDAKPTDGIARPMDHTSYGHNVEFAWLLLHAADVLGHSRDMYGEVVRKIVDNCVEFGIDPEFGGVYADGPAHAPTTTPEKQFWQQAEVLVGLLDACLLFGGERYWPAFVNVYDFVFDHFVCMESGGEWYERVDREGNPIDDALGHAWKINYHTVRSMIQTVRRLQLVTESVNVNLPHDNPKNVNQTTSL